MRVTAAIWFISIDLFIIAVLGNTKNHKVLPPRPPSSPRLALSILSIPGVAKRDSKPVVIL